MSNQKALFASHCIYVGKIVVKLTLWGSIWEALSAYFHHPAYPADIAVSSKRRTAHSQKLSQIPV